MSEDLGRLHALHRRFAGPLRTAARWLGVADEAEREALVDACFVALARGPVPEDSASGWAALMRQLARALPGGPADDPPAPRDPAEAAGLRWFARLPAGERAVFALAELGGFDAPALARAIGAPEEVGRAKITGLRRAFAEDPAVAACGGPRAVLTTCVAIDRAPPGWQEERWAALQPGRAASEPGQALQTVAVMALLALVALWAAPPAATIAEAPEPAPTLPAAAMPAPVVVPAPALPVLAPPVPAPKDMLQKTGPERKVVVARRPPRPRKAAAERPAAPEPARDAGTVIVELEMLGAARKALASAPGQALAYADQHAREYPVSQLVEERAEVRVRALCALGRAGEAQAAAQGRGKRVQAALREACKT